MLTNKGLVEHVKMALNEKWGYVWGTYGDVLTPLLLHAKVVQYPIGVGKYEEYIKNQWLGRRTADCVGLIKSYLWWYNGEPIYNTSTDVTADGMKYKATSIDTMYKYPKEDIPGLCLWKSGHVGVYIGDGQVIEANSTSLGVIQTPLKGRGATNWTHWFRCPYITYEEVLPLPKDYVEIIQEVSVGSSDAWIKGIDTLVKVAETTGNVGDLEIFRHLPTLIENVYKKYTNS